jgi:uncharacterized membrane-anchored protein YitT (DUF2179 family)
MVTEYLINTKGYQYSDLISVEGTFGKLPNYSVYVVFKDINKSELKHLD